MLETPVVLFIFNRPNTTRRVIDAIAQVAPKRLFVIADGPRNEFEREACLAARAVAADAIKWSCELITDFSEINLGSRKRFKSGLDHVFRLSEDAIVLEDDCLPDKSFFSYCSELLDKYRGDEQIGIISGNNFQFGRRRTRDSYYFSRLLHTWGWATWRRVWNTYDVEMKEWTELRETNWLKSILGEPEFVDYWSTLFDMTVSEHGSQIWDYQMCYSGWRNERLNIVPCQNLVSNIGFGEGATHTFDANQFSNIPAGEMRFPLQHPSDVVQHLEADHFTLKQLIAIDNPGLLTRLRAKMVRIASTGLSVAGT